MNTLTVFQRENGKFGCVKIVWVQADGGDTAVKIGGVIVNTIRKVHSGGIAGVVVFALGRFKTALWHFRSGEQMEKLLDFLFFWNFFGKPIDKKAPGKARHRGIVPRQTHRAKSERMKTPRRRGVNFRRRAVAMQIFFADQDR